MNCTVRRSTTALGLALSVAFIPAACASSDEAGLEESTLDRGEAVEPLTCEERHGTCYDHEPSCELTRVYHDWEGNELAWKLSAFDAHMSAVHTSDCESCCGVVPTCGEDGGTICDNGDGRCSGRWSAQTSDCAKCCGAAPTCGELGGAICDRGDGSCHGNGFGSDDCDRCCGGAVGPMLADVDVWGDCRSFACPPWAPHPIGCELEMYGNDPRGCVALFPGSSTVYFQEGDDCKAGSVVGRMLCSDRPGAIDATSCAFAKMTKLYPTSAGGCPQPD